MFFFFIFSFSGNSSDTWIWFFEEHRGKLGASGKMCSGGDAGLFFQLLTLDDVTSWSKAPNTGKQNWHHGCSKNVKLQMSKHKFKPFSCKLRNCWCKPDHTWGCYVVYFKNHKISKNTIHTSVPRPQQSPQVQMAARVPAALTVETGGCDDFSRSATFSSGQSKYGRCILVLTPCWHDAICSVMLFCWHPCAGVWLKVT